jgi:hypothetical protein
MAAFSRDELEQAFRTYWRAGAVGEDWDTWTDLFTDDCEYFEHFFGTMHGRETVREWIKPIMQQFSEIYTVYAWHVIDEKAGRVTFYMHNRRDRPGGGAPIDFPGISILEYAGNGKWKREEDFWAMKESERAMREYHDACTQHDPEHANKMTRANWGCGPEWTRGGPSYAERRSARD